MTLPVPWVATHFWLTVSNTLSDQLSLPQAGIVVGPVDPAGSDSARGGAAILRGGPAFVNEK